MKHSDLTETPSERSETGGLNYPQKYNPVVG